ncbi:MAG: phosphate signaling complex protein PhoU [Actinomycetota bacterium]
MEELRRNYHEELDHIRNELALLAARVVELIPRGTAVLLDGDLEGAERIIQGDAEIDAHSVTIEEQCIKILALQSPVSRDLRQVLAVFKIIAEIERSADLVANICKAARRIYGHELDPKLRGLISRMGEQAQALYVAAIEALQEGDAAKAAAINDMDAYLDALHKEFISAIFESHANELLDLQVGVQLAMVGRFYERIGDHAVNMGERVLFMITGKVPDHSRPDRAPIDRSAGDLS